VGIDPFLINTAQVHLFVHEVVMPAHRHSKNGAASLAYVAGIHVFLARPKTWMAGTSPAVTRW
jgi:hypothetical protein